MVAQCPRQKRRPDPVGKTFGKLRVLEKAGRNRWSQQLYRCLCSCGQETVVSGSQLHRGYTKSCKPCAIKDIVGQRFGRLVAIAPEPDTRACVRCRCDCGNEIVFQGLLLKKGKRRSCGRCGMQNIVGKRFGRLLAIEPEPGTRTGVRCRCDCGTELILTGPALKKGKRSSCGRCRTKDTSGKRFGRLLAIEPVPGRRAHFRCRCDCGNEIVCYGVALRSGNKRSCGCADRVANRKQSRDALTGKVSGRLTVTDDQRKTKCGHYERQCICTCGAEKWVRESSLRSGATRSCGCHQYRGRRRST